MKKCVFLCLLYFLSFPVLSQTPDILDIKIGQMILIGMPKAELDEKVLEEVKKGKVGALIFFEKNIPNKPNAFASVKNMTWTYQKAASIPLFICIDQEGGKVNRLKEKYGFTRYKMSENIQILQYSNFYLQTPKPVSLFHIRCYYKIKYNMKLMSKG